MDPTVNRTVNCTVQLLGPGRAGTALGTLLARAGWPIGAVIGRSLETGARAVQVLGSGTPTVDPSAAFVSGSCLLVAVPDHAIGSVAESLAREAQQVNAAVALHLSGSQSHERLAPLRARGFAVGGLHPMYAFAHQDQPPQHLRGVGFAISGDPEARALAGRMVEDLDAVALEVADDRRALHHAACATASNALVALFNLAVHLEQAAGADPQLAARALLGLVEGTVANLRSLGVPHALTGPAERGETEVLRAHIDAIRHSAPEHWRLYQALATATVDVATAKGSLTVDQAEALRQLLEEERNPP